MGSRYEKDKKKVFDNKNTTEKLNAEKDMLKNEYSHMALLDNVQALMDDEINDVVKTVRGVGEIEAQRIESESGVAEDEKQQILNEINGEIAKLNLGLKKLGQACDINFGKGATEQSRQEYKKQIDKFRNLIGELGRYSVDIGLDMFEGNKSEANAFYEKKTEASMNVSEAMSFEYSLFQETQGTTQKFYNSFETRIRITPADGVRGKWEGERGNSKYIPSTETDEGKIAKQKLAKKGQDGIIYTNAEPDFSKCAEATVEIDNMTENRFDYNDVDGNRMSGNFEQADAKYAEQWNAIKKNGRSDWDASDVRDWRRENKLSWHERCDTRTMDLVSKYIHNYFGHYGGCSECKVRDTINLDGGGFDE